ncbi:MAG: amidohydrolase family protein, partial [Bacteroidota bacterium]|nr:amidohydrolase family protein [Bacteroidota bacterium]
MKKALLFLLPMPFFFTSLFAQTGAIDSGAFTIHKFAQNIGKEIWVKTKTGDTVRYDMNFNYIDRGSPVALKATLELTSGLEPVSYRIKGGTSRFSSINDSIVITNKEANIKVDDSSYIKKLTGISFPVAGYSPATTQMLLVDYWKKNNESKRIHMLPFGDAQINKDGEDTVFFNGKNIVVNRYVIKGLIWGNELLWIDEKGSLICLITNDAEGDKQEMMREEYEPLLSTFISKAAVYGMRLFTNGAKPSFQKHSLIAITNGTLVDVEKGATIVNAVVLIEGGKIKNAGAASSVKIPNNAFVINAKNKTILPGLWDMHAHFEQAEWGPAYLAAGVTNVRDCGNEFVYINAVQKAIDEGKGIGPHIIKAGIIDGKGSKALGIVQADTKEEAIAEVDRYKDSGFAQIKIYSSVKPPIVKAICDEAHRLGLTVTGHIPEGMNLMQGVDSGMDMVNHVQYVFSVLKKNKDFAINWDDSTNKAVLHFIKAHHVVIDPTLGVFELSLRSLSDSITTIEPAFATLPLPLQVIFKNTGISEQQYKMYGKSVMDAFKSITKKLYDDSVTIVAGTDMDFPGYSLDRELELYVESGLTPLQAIQTATITPARVMKRDDHYGSITAGKNADVIIVDADPLQNIRNIRKVSVVIKDGNVYNP